jgi:hypothetical protein
MDWFAAFDAYCERLTHGFGAEPFNMVTGLAFLVVGVFAYRRAPRGEDCRAAVALGLVGVASAVQHGFSVVLTQQADIVANLAYLWLLGALMLRRLVGLRSNAALAGALAVVSLAFAAGKIPELRQGLGFGSDMFVMLLVVVLAAALGQLACYPATARRVVLAGAVLAAGLPFRFLDAGLCAVWPIGTHGIWHLCNAAASLLLLRALARHAGEPTPALAKGGEGR